MDLPSIICLHIVSCDHVFLWGKFNLFLNREGSPQILTCQQVIILQS